jgi:FAD-dependent urate hydroxylase
VANNSDVRIVIAGAGIGGLAIAHALLERQHDVTVVEGAPALRAGGAAISVWHNGHAALRRLGLSLPDAGERIASLNVLRSDGTTQYELDAVAVEQRIGVEARLLRRSDLVQHLFEQVPAGTVVFDRPVIGVRSGPGRQMTVQVGGGEALVADLVIGADGHRSGVRRFVHDTGAAKPTGLLTWQGVHPVQLSAGRPGESLYIQGDEGWCGLMPAGDGWLQWWFDLPAEAADAVPTEDRVAFLKARFGSWAAPVPEVIDQVRADEIEPWPYTWHPVPRSLYVDRAVLIGDAAHAMPPTLAQGSSQTLDDAWALTEALEHQPSVEAALSDYNHRRRGRAAAVARLARSRAALRGAPAWVAPISRRVPSRVSTAVFVAMLTAASDALPLS